MLYMFLGLNETITHMLVSKDGEVKMVKLSIADQTKAIGHLEAVWKQRDVAVLFDVSHSTKSKLRLRYRDTHDVKDRPKSGRPRSSTDRVDRSNRLSVDFEESWHHCTQPTYALSRTS